MILKLGSKHQAMELYEIYINHDSGMTLTYLANLVCKCHFVKLLMVPLFSCHGYKKIETF